ncbi:M14 family metallopeptidase [Psychroflexus aestuariivivens]|uniref:M14 family metallopeptidase n=1 Tax=Psychroflexus aestuariivivens TaxID=1795040 RepID=UPI000FD8E741|nr:M14 family metallopeptidase [Psychroflexus aestuariivivens]
MWKYSLLFIIILSLFSCKNETKENDGNETNEEEFNITTTFEDSKGYSTSTYEEVIHFYEKLAEEFSSVSIQEHYETDIGKPLKLVKFSKENGSDSPLKILINNGIHPGEPDGVDASMLLFRALAKGDYKIPENIEIYAIPIYNVGGALNRNSYSRTNQKGPAEYGFRGNAKNLDLNRDFIKSDSKNSKAFFEVYHEISPDIFVDTHVSNGADYQYTLTHLFTQHNKLGGDLGEFLNQTYRPDIERDLEEKSWKITPYVNVFNKSPEYGFTQFNDSPRYSTGYTSLWNSIGLMIETHMLKPYNKRVEGTLSMLKSIIEISDKHQKEIQNLRQDRFEKLVEAEYYPINFKVDSTQNTTLNFLGYEVEKLKSEVTGLDRIKFNREKPYNKEIKYYNSFKPTDSVKIPKSYVIPQQWTSVIELLKWNDISYTRLFNDTLMEVEAYRIEDFKTRNSPYEGHYLHSETKVSSEIMQRQFRSGDIIVNTNQKGIRYLLETLEPEAVDSFFNWNFFDSILQQKEGFSPYVFEDLAIEILAKNPELKAEFEEKQNSDPKFAKNWYAQLDWIHKRSKYYESTHRLYPIFRVHN